MPDIVLDGNEDRSQDSNQELDILLDGLVLSFVSVDLNLGKQFHGLFARWGLHFEPSKVAEVVLEYEEEQTRQYVPDQIRQWHGSAFTDAELVVFARALDSPVFETVNLTPVQSAEDTSKVASGNLAPSPVLV